MWRFLALVAVCGLWPATAVAAEVNAGGVPASALYCGDLPCTSAFAGGGQVWPPGPPPEFDKVVVASGNWDNPAIWSPPGVPGQGDSVYIGPFTVEADRNIIVDGPTGSYAGGIDSLTMRPETGTAALHFPTVVESSIGGGGLFPCGTAPPSSDVGLWGLCDGVLDIEGTFKTPWVELAGTEFSGSQFLDLEASPVGWQVGDRIVIAPSEHPDVGDRFWNGFEERVIISLNGTTVGIDAPLSHPHPSATNPWTGEVFGAEVINLTRDVRISGTSSGRSHMLIQTTVPQRIKNAEFEWMGPSGKAGRYPVHFHYSGDGSRGSLLSGVVVHRSEERAFVPHGSHGITFLDTVAYDIEDDAYWWDPSSTNDENTDPERSDDIVMDRTMAAFVKEGAFSANRLTGYNLRHSAFGHEPILRNSIAVGIEVIGFLWPETSGGLWIFDERNLAHNVRGHGIFVWQNSGNEHIIKDFLTYRNGAWGVNHGAYINLYQYIDVDAWENDDAGLLDHAVGVCNDEDGICFRADGYSLAFERYRADSVMYITKHRVINQDPPVLVKDSEFTGILVNENYDGNDRPASYDFVRVVVPDGAGGVLDLEPSDFQLMAVSPGSLYRVQRRDGTAYQMDHAGNVTTIAAFYP